MRTAPSGYWWFGGRMVAAVFGCGVLVEVVAAQDVTRCGSSPASPTEVAAPASQAPAVGGAGAEAEKPERLLARFTERRAVLDRRRRELARERDRLLAVDRPAGKADIERWHDCAETGEALMKKVEVLQALSSVLTPQALKEVSIPEVGGAGTFESNVGWARTTLAVNLRSAPDFAQEGEKILEAEALVVQLASSRTWSVIATRFGLGFVPSSQLRRER